MKNNPLKNNPSKSVNSPFSSSRYLCCMIAAAISVSVSSCDSEAYDIPNGTDPLERSCIASGGDYDAEAKKCTCLSKVCHKGIVCSLETKACADEQTESMKSACMTSGGEYDEDKLRCTCSDEMCDDGVVCNTRTKKCSNMLPQTCLEEDNICRSGNIYTCENEAWKFTEACESNVCRSDNSACADCAGTETKCENNQESVCNGGVWKPGSKCPNGCDENGKTCLIQCKEDDVKCENNHMYLCNAADHSWKEGVECPLGCNDEKNACRAECGDGEQLCTNGTDGIGKLKTCAGGQYGTETACEGDVSCNADGKTCGECKNGSTQCTTGEDGIGKLKTCAGGQYGTETACEGDVSCNADEKTCGVCKNETVHCENDAEQNFGVMQICRDGLYIVKDPDQPKCMDESGTQPVSCNADKTACGECLNDNVRCFNNTSQIGMMQICSEGQFINRDEDPDDPNAKYCKVLNQNVSCDINMQKCGECLNKEKSWCDPNGFEKLTCVNGALTIDDCRANNDQICKNSGSGAVCTNG